MFKMLNSGIERRKKMRELLQRIAVSKGRKKAQLQVEYDTLLAKGKKLIMHKAI